MFNRKMRFFSPYGLRKFRENREKLAHNKNWGPILRLLIEWLLKKFDSHFDLQGVDQEGNKTQWAPRKHDYWYDGKKLPRRPVLIRSGDMRRSMKGKVVGNNMDFSFDVDYWVYHERGKGRMERKTFVITDEYQQVIADSLAYYRITGEAKIVENGRV